MRRLFALSIVFAGLATVAAPAAAQSAIALLPSGVTLRINGPGSDLVGVLYQQSLDSVWLRQRGNNTIVRSIAVPRIQRVDQARPEYVKSMLVGTGLGVLVGVALYSVTPHSDHDLYIGLSVIGGAVAGLLFPHTAWKSVPLH
jgi:hypothetical protein